MIIGTIYKYLKIRTEDGLIMSGWQIKGEQIVVEQDSSASRIYTSLYTKGINLVPRMLLNEQQDYGVILDDRKLSIEQERYYEVHFGLREKVKHDHAFKIKLRDTTWAMLDRFKEATLSFERAVLKNELTSQLLEDSIQACAEVLSLCEFNGMIPRTWLTNELEKLSPDYSLSVDDFAYCEVVPHRVLLRIGKLNLLEQYLKNDHNFDDADIRSFIRDYGLYDPTMSDPLLLRPSEQPDIIRKEIEMMAQTMGLEDIQKELDLISYNRQDGYLRYHQNLEKVGSIMERNGIAVDIIQNFLSTLAIVSLAATEEEYRHIWMDRFWRSLGYVARGLELPVALITLNDLATSFRQNGKLRIPANF